MHEPHTPKPQHKMPSSKPVDSVSVPPLSGERIDITHTPLGADKANSQAGAESAPTTLNGLTIDSEVRLRILSSLNWFEDIGSI
jgi:hypothetical protein